MWQTYHFFDQPDLNSKVLLLLEFFTGLFSLRNFEIWQILTSIYKVFHSSRLFWDAKKRGKQKNFEKCVFHIQENWVLSIKFQFFQVMSPK